MRDRLTYGLYAAGWALVRRLPERVAYALFAAVADVAWWRHGPGVQQLEANLRRAATEISADGLRQLSRAGMRTYLRYWCDTFRLPDWDAARVVGTVRVIGEDHLRRSTGPGQRGVVAALLHMGNWDHAGAWASLTGAPVVTVAERLRPERLFARFLAYREALGMEVLPLTGGDGGVIEVLGDRLRAGQFVPLLADRDLGGAGLGVDLLGAPARLPAGPAMLALRTGAALHPVSVWHEPADAGPPRLVVCFHDEVPVPDRATGPTRARLTAMTQQVADVLGRAIVEHPEHWHMLQPVWSADREQAAEVWPA